MAPIAAFASVARSIDYLRDLRIRNGGLYVRRTGARINFNLSFLRSAASAVSIYFYVLGVQASRLVKGEKPRASIAFWPQLASPWYNAWTVSQFAGLKITSNPAAADYVFVFEDTTYADPAHRAPEGVDAPTINERVNDISKKHVSDVFSSVFGYDLDIDPLTHEGPAVVKSQINGAHDGRIIECPIEASAILPDHVYQRLVDSSFNGKTSEDLRIVYAFGDIPVVFHKHKALEQRFGTTYLSTDVREAADVFSPEEIRLICQTCDRVGLDFGAVDIMRDRHTNRIYVVDVNNTCMPVLSLPLGEQIKAYRRIARSFRIGLKRICESQAF